MTDMILTTGGINWTWYLHITIGDDAMVTIHRYDRLHNERDAGRHPKVDGHGCLIEDDDRIVQAVEIGDDTVYLVANPKYVFDYSV